MVKSQGKPELSVEMECAILRARLIKGCE